VSPIKSPQGAYPSRVGAERCGNGFSFVRGNSVAYSQRTRDKIR
jgi:hypothetical protein